MNRTGGKFTQSGRNFVPNPELVLKSRTLAARKRNPEVHANYIIPVLNKALSILNLLEEAKQPMNTQQIAKATGYALTTVYRILRTFSAHGYFPDGEHGLYTYSSSPGPMSTSKDPLDEVVPAS
jgi:hypothetical protein